MRIVVCTAWFGQSAWKLKPPAVIHPQVRYVCLTDRSESISGWKMQRVQQTERPRWLARWAKTNLIWLGPHDVSIWMDASFELLVNPIEIVRVAAATTAPIIGFVHPDRTRISQEAEAIIRAGQAPAAAVRQQLATYQATGFDTVGRPQTILTTTGFLVRWESPDVRAFNEAWWHEIQTHTLRDQMSIDYCAGRKVLPIGYLPGHYRSNRFARYYPAAHKAMVAS